MTRGSSGSDQPAQMQRVREGFPKFRYKLNIREEECAREKQELIFQAHANYPRQEKTWLNMA